MRKQLLKGFAMLMAVMAVAMVSAVASANGQTTATRATIPFEFVVGNQSLPAGDYRVSAMNSAGDALRIVSGANAKDSALRLTMPANGTSKSAKLVFHRYGERYFLAEVWSSAEGGRQLIPSKQERAIQKENSRIASTKPGSCHCDTIEIVATLQ